LGWTKLLKVNLAGQRQRHNQTHRRTHCFHIAAGCRRLIGDFNSRERGGRMPTYGSSRICSVEPTVSSDLSSFAMSRQWSEVMLTGNGDLLWSDGFWLLIRAMLSAEVNRIGNRCCFRIRPVNGHARGSIAHTGAVDVCLRRIRSFDGFPPRVESRNGLSAGIPLSFEARNATRRGQRIARCKGYDKGIRESVWIPAVPETGDLCRMPVGLQLPTVSTIVSVI
jgi:hypothetical protein